MKKYTLPLCIICLIITLSACSKEAAGVPDSVIFRDINYKIAGYEINSASNHTVTHNVDTDAHIDDAILSLCFEGAYGTKTITVPFTYQYNKASDLWVMLDGGTATSERTINESSYIDASPWTGKVEGKHGYRYSITFHQIDTNSMTATISCEIDFETDSIPDVSKTVTVNLDDLGGACDHVLSVDCSYERYIGNGYWTTEEVSAHFFLNYDNGLTPW